MRKGDLGRFLEKSKVKLNVWVLWRMWLGRNGEEPSQAGRVVVKRQRKPCGSPASSLLFHSLSGSSGLLWPVVSFVSPCPSQRRRTWAWKPSPQFHADVRTGEEIMKPNCLSEQHLSDFSHEVSEGMECNWSQGSQGSMSALAPLPAWLYPWQVRLPDLNK